MMDFCNCHIVAYTLIKRSEHNSYSSSSSVGATARCGLWPVEQYLSIFPYLWPTFSIFSLPALEDIFLLLLSILSWVFLFVSSLPVLEWRSFWASYSPPFSPGDPANLSFAPLYILLYFLLYSTLLVSDSSYSSIPIFIFRTMYSSKYFPFKNKLSLFFLLRHRPCFRSICYYRSY